MRIAIVSVFAWFCMFVSTAFADPVGTYRVDGTNPGTSTKYVGTVVVQRTGETYSVVWTVAGAQFVGTALGVAAQNGKTLLGPAHPSDNGLTIAYVSGGSFGLAIMSEEGNGRWAGYWAAGGGTQLGTEIWTRQ